jgi:hypothetical protein
MVFEYPDDVEAEGIVELEPDVVNQIVEFYKGLMNNESVAPCDCGKSQCFRELVERSDFLPKSIQTMIDNNRGEMSRKDYLFMHDYFSREFSTYLI